MSERFWMKSFLFNICRSSGGMRGVYLDREVLFIFQLGSQLFTLSLDHHCYWISARDKSRVRHSPRYKSFIHNQDLDFSTRMIRNEQRNTLACHNDGLTQDGGAINVCWTWHITSKLGMFQEWENICKYVLDKSIQKLYSHYLYPPWDKSMPGVGKAEGIKLWKTERA